MGVALLITANSLSISTDFNPSNTVHVSPTLSDSLLCYQFPFLYMPFEFLIVLLGFLNGYRQLI
jgi:hypothetical protein